MTKGVEGWTMPYRLSCYNDDIVNGTPEKVYWLKAWYHARVIEQYNFQYLFSKN